MIKKSEVIKYLKLIFSILFSIASIFYLIIHPECFFVLSIIVLLLGAVSLLACAIYLLIE